VFRVTGFGGQDKYKCAALQAFGRKKTDALYSIVDGIQ
jgi:hypothetical protein